MAMELSGFLPSQAYVSCMGGHMDYSIIPLRALNLRCQQQLSIALLQEVPLLAPGGIKRDWQGLSELAGCSYDMIMSWKNNDNPVLDMLYYWSNQSSNPSVADLINKLELLERFDIIDDLKILFERDALAYLQSDEYKRLVEDKLRPVQLTQVNSVDMMTVSKPLTVDDVMDIEAAEHGIQRKPTQYDAYISYVEADADFAFHMVTRLENYFKLKLYVKERDMLPGLVESDADLTMINERFEKILLIVSKTSLRDAQSEWLAIMAQACAVDSSFLSRKVIPIVNCKDCELPPRFKNLPRLHYNKKDMFGSFWKRLYCSIKSPMPEIYMENGQTAGPYLLPQTVSDTKCGAATLPMGVLHLIPELSLTRTTDDPTNSMLFEMMGNRSRSPTPSHCFDMMTDRCSSNTPQHPSGQPSTRNCEQQNTTLNTTYTETG